MPISFTIDLSDQDIQRLVQATKPPVLGADKASVDAAIAAATKLIADASKDNVPKFVSERLEKLDRMIAMVHDEGWALEEADSQRVLKALAYFIDPNDFIADDVPVIGFLDDAIMIEVCARELEPELVAYAEFCSFRQEEAGRLGLDPAKVGRAEWLNERRAELHEYMRSARGRDYGEGYGSSSGYKAKTTYVGNAWRPSLFRTS
ncbi:MAG: DUF1232 domain-containing protein [Proteobacteria bacterium]|nr:DUF1232 domain-containing protein [Pseudomonadota bacterium]MBS0462895.1 DUF1232 domain-containing protein [Pseudomonadota bacterium]MBS0463383.1 DUF1232 domain-containing protein [Pseudomonadota bacterium]